MKYYKNIWLVEVPQYILVIFVILQFISMLTYSSGTFFDPLNHGYSFTRNFLSDLGRTESFSGNINFISCQIFNLSLIMAGCVFIMYFINVHNIFVLHKYYKLAYLGSILGIMAGIALIGVGMTPSDLYLSQHVLSAKWLFRCFLGSSVCYSIIIIRSNIFKNNYAIGYMFFAFLIFSYIILSELGPDPKESELALTFQVISQKIILLVLISAVFLQTIGLKKLRH